MVRQQKFYNAIELYLSFVKDYPQHRRAPEALFEVGNIQQTMLNDTKKAATTYRKLVSKYPIGRFTLMAQRRIAELEMNTHADYRQAIVEFEKLIQAAPNDPNAAAYQLEIARGYTRLHNYEQAAVEYKALVTKYPKFDGLDEAYFQAGNNAYIWGKYEEAVSSYRTVIERFAGSKFRIESLFGLGQAYEEMEFWDQARESYGKVLKEDPSRKKIIETRLAGLSSREKKKTALATGAKLKPAPMPARRAEQKKHARITVIVPPKAEELEKTDDEPAESEKPEVE